MTFSLIASKEGRRMPAQKVKKLAEGRIYSGKRAYETGLVGPFRGSKSTLCRSP